MFAIAPQKIPKLMSWSVKSRDDGSSAVKQFFGGEYEEVEEELKELDEVHDDGEV